MLVLLVWRGPVCQLPACQQAPSEKSVATDAAEAEKKALMERLTQAEAEKKTVLEKYAAAEKAKEHALMKQHAAESAANEAAKAEIAAKCAQNAAEIQLANIKDQLEAAMERKIREMLGERHQDDSQNSSALGQATYLG